MPDLERLQLPLRPSGHSLAAHISALDLLAARLDALPMRSRWGARVPLNSKASFDGDIVHTNEVKVNVGGDWWVEMSAHEAADWVRRRKAAMLEEHARVTEGQAAQPKAEEQPTAAAGQRVLRTKDIAFDPLLGNPPQPPAQTQQPTPGTGPAANAGPAQSDRAAPTSTLVDKGKQVDVPQSLQSLVDLVGEHLQDKLHIPNGESTVNEDGEPIYEIREDADGRPLAPLPEGAGEGSIEVPEGEDASYFSPEAVARRAALRRRIFHEGDSDDGMDVDDKKEEGMDVDAEDDPETPKARVPDSSSAPIFQQPFQTALHAAQIGDITTPTTPTQPSLPSVQASPSRPKGILKQPARKKSVSFDESVPIPPDSPPPRRHGFPLDQMIASTRPVDANGMPAPKPVPIIRAPMPGRRGQPESFGGLRSGFLSSAPILSLAPQVESSRTAMTKPEPRQPSPMELARKAEEKAPVKGEVEEKAPPAQIKTEEEPLAQPSVFPRPKAKPEQPLAQPSVFPRPKAQPEPTLAQPSVFPKPKAEAQPPAPAPAPVHPVQMQVEEKRASDKALDAMDVDAPPAKVQKVEAAPKKKSLFAQRRTPSFPKQSDTLPMATMKGAVVEAPPVAPAPQRAAGPPAVGSSSTDTPMVIVDDDSDDDDYGDLGDFSDDEEDEYALDEALLAREIALQYHRRQAWQRPADEDELDPEAEAAHAEAVLGIPRVSTVSGAGADLRIVNPTADDLSQFLRVGRADDGELVFEQPLVHSESESDGEDDGPGALDRRERRARRKDVMARLMRGEYEDLPAPAPPGLRAEQYEASLPPSVGAMPPVKIEEVDDGLAGAAQATSTAASNPATAQPIPPAASPAAPKQPPPTRDVVERAAAQEPSAPTPPKKVSRFKAARMQS